MTAAAAERSADERLQLGEVAATVRQSSPEVVVAAAGAAPRPSCSGGGGVADAGC